MTKVKAIRGMNDVLPEQSSLWLLLEKTIVDITRQYGYSQIRMPIVEQTALFKRSIGDATDIIEKEMYTFEDRNGDSLSLRPEGTASCVRACIEHGLLHNQTHRLWYAGPMFRYEKPQKGRYRQFHQIGFETFGWAGPDIDIELIAMTARLWQRLGLTDQVELQINSVGNIAERQQYKAALVEFLSGHKDALDEDSLNRLDKNPLRILDSKNLATQQLLDDAPVLADYLSESSRDHFNAIQENLSALNIPFAINPRLVRGLDYYNDIVFEWVTQTLGAQGTVCAGGRYDGLVEQLGGRATPAVGCAMGVERLLLMLEHLKPQADKLQLAHVYVITQSDSAKQHAIALAEMLRQSLPSLRVILHCGGGKLKSQFKKADQSGAQLALIIGDKELEHNVYSIKSLRENDQQHEVEAKMIIEFLNQKLNLD